MVGHPIYVKYRSIQVGIISHSACCQEDIVSESSYEKRVDVVATLMTRRLFRDDVERRIGILAARSRRSALVILIVVVIVVVVIVSVAVILQCRVSILRENILSIAPGHVR